VIGSNFLSRINCNVQAIHCTFFLAAKSADLALCNLVSIRTLYDYGVAVCFRQFVWANCKRVASRLFFVCFVFPLRFAILTTLGELFFSSLLR
jgi:hypothetical protein